jgi:hypothetical protein
MPAFSSATPRRGRRSSSRNQPAKRIDRPAVAGRYHVDVPVEVHDRARPAAARSNDVDPRVSGGVLGASFGLDVLDLERATLQEVAEEVRAGVVLLAGRVDGWNPHEIGGELDDLIGRAIDFGQDSLDGLHG